MSRDKYAEGCHDGYRIGFRDGFRDAIMTMTALNAALNEGNERRAARALDVLVEGMGVGGRTGVDGTSEGAVANALSAGPDRTETADAQVGLTDYLSNGTRAR